MAQFLCWIVRDGWAIHMAIEVVDGRDKFAMRITKGDITFARCCDNEPDDVSCLVSKLESFAAENCT